MKLIFGTRVTTEEYRTTTFWSTLCKTVCTILSDRCSVCLTVCLSCLSVTLVYCGQMVGWIKIKLRMDVGLSPGHIVDLC